MKKSILLFAALILCAKVWPQVHQGITHQAVMRNAANELVTNQEVGIQVSILQGSAEGTAVFVETHQPESNQNGLITYVIGQGTLVSGSFADIDWADGPYFLKTEADPEGGTNYSITGVTQFHSVPYAYHSNTFTGQEDMLARIEALEDALYNGDNDNGNENENGTVTDIDGNEYLTVIIGNQEWMAENLRVTRYRNGDDIPAVFNDEDWEETTDGAYAVYPHAEVDGVNSPEEMVDAYGKLYNWHAVDDTRGLCPEGWHVPSDDEWTELGDYLGGNSDAGGELKSTRRHPQNPHPRWDNPNTGATNASGFSGLPASQRMFDGSYWHEPPGGHASIWTSTEEYPDSEFAWSRFLRYNRSDLQPYIGSRRGSGRSVRCIYSE